MKVTINLTTKSTSNLNIRIVDVVSTLHSRPYRGLSPALSGFLLMLLLFCNHVSLEATGDRPTVGLALSGGAAKGLAHIGVLKAIDEMGIEIDYIAGTSIGALIGGLYASGYSGLEIEQMVNETSWDELLVETVSREDYYIGDKRWKEYYNISFMLDDKFMPMLPKGIISGNRIINYLFCKTYSYNHIRDFNELPIPFASVAVDLVSTELVVYRTGSLPEAIRASLSYPSMFEPFLYKGRYNVDGGIKMNLPSTVVKEMGADIVIGVRFEPDFGDIDMLSNPIEVLEQAINITTYERALALAEKCDILIQPDLADIRITDFDKTDEIISVGMASAREVLSKHFVPLRTDYSAISDTGNILPDTLKLTSISVYGNKYLSNSKVVGFTGLKANSISTKEDIINGVNAAYRTNLFKELYPRIEEEEGGYRLCLRAVERPRNRIGINAYYNEKESITVGLSLEMKNYLGNNSRFIASLKLGGYNEFLIDYVKNFTRDVGVYYRVFPYINEKSIIVYNEMHQRIFSSKAREYGFTAGVGGYFFDDIVVESYLFGFQQELFRDIGNVEEEIYKDFYSTGVGVKLYKESLDDTVFPMRGDQLLLKYIYADKFSKERYRRLHCRAQFLVPLYTGRNGGVISRGRGGLLTSNSLRFQLEYGSYLGGETIDCDPFYTGGIDSFLGSYRNQDITPVVKILTVANRVNLKNNYYIDLHFNVADYSQDRHFEFFREREAGGGIIVGYRSSLGPFRLGLGMKERRNLRGYISFGYDLDPFEFSRR